MLEDMILVWKLRRGNTDALRVIYEKYRDDLLRIAAGLLRDKSKAEDAVHDVFTAFVSTSANFTLTGSLRGYFTTCLANKARNINRETLRRQTANIDEVKPAVCKLKRPDEWIIYDEQFERISKALAQLPYEQREAVVLHIHGSMKFKDISGLQQTSVKTVLSRYRYGINKLRSILKSEV